MKLNETEFEFSNGRFIGLCPKTYLGKLQSHLKYSWHINLGINYDDPGRDGRKTGTKGLPHHLKLEMDEFKTALYGSESHYVTLHGLRLNPDGQMCKTKLTKRGLTGLFKKFRIENDGITCSPLMKNGKIL